MDTHTVALSSALAVNKQTSSASHVEPTLNLDYDQVLQEWKGVFTLCVGCNLGSKKYAYIWIQIDKLTKEKTQKNVSH